MVGRVEVAIGVLVGGEGVLIARRRAGDLMGGYWEFPGGKIEPGEAPQACLRREFVEELGVHVEVGELVIPDDPVDHDYDHGRVRLHCFWCSLAADVGAPQCLEVDEWRWIAPAALRDYRFLPANGPIIDAVVTALVGDPVE